MDPNDDLRVSTEEHPGSGAIRSAVSIHPRACRYDAGMWIIINEPIFLIFLMNYFEFNSIPPQASPTLLLAEMILYRLRCSRISRLRLVDLPRRA